MSKLDPCLEQNIPWRRCLSTELQTQFQIFAPTIASMVLYKIPQLISLRFVGQIGSDQLAAAALATTLCNVTGISLSVGLSSAMTTLTGQARGDLLAKAEEQRLMDCCRRLCYGHGSIVKEQNTIKDKLEQSVSTIETASTVDSKNDDGFPDEEAPLLVKIETDGGMPITCSESVGDQVAKPPLLPLMILYRGLFLQLIFVIPVGIWWLSGIKPMLLALGQAEAVSSMAEDYLRILTPGLWAYSINWTLTAWLQALEMADVPACTAGLGLILHIPVNLITIYGFSWGYLGCAAATVVFQSIQPLALIWYLFVSKDGVARVLSSTAAHAIGVYKLSFWKEFKVGLTCWAGIKQYLGLAVSGIVIISEGWASEVSIFLAGTLQPDPALGLDAMTIYQTINTFCFMFPVGCSVACATRVGNLLGASAISGTCHEVDFAAKVSVGSAAVLSGGLMCLMYFLPHTLLPSFFSPDETVVDEAAKLIPLLAIYVFADGIQAALYGIVKGCGRQPLVMPIVIFSYWVVGVPLGFYITFVRHEGLMCSDVYFCGIVGLVTGLAVGTWLHMILMVGVVAVTTNWHAEAKKCAERLSAEEQSFIEATPSVPRAARRDSLRRTSTRRESIRRESIRRESIHATISRV